MEDQEKDEKVMKILEVINGINVGDCLGILEDVKDAVFSSACENNFKFIKV